MVKQVSVHDTVGWAGKAGMYIREMGKGGFKKPKGGWLHRANREYRQVKQEGVMYDGMMSLPGIVDYI